VFQSLSVVALRQLVCGACNAVGMGAAADDIVRFLNDRFTNHSQKLTSALQTANDRAWKALEIALAGDSLWHRCTAAADDRELGNQIRGFLDVSPLRKVKAEQRPILEKALQELRTARNKGLLAGGPLAPEVLAKEVAALAAFRDPQAVMDAEWKALTRVADELREMCPNLYHVLRAKISPPVLAVALKYYFRREIETDAELFRGLAFAKLEALQDSQDKGFAALTEALARQGSRVEQALAEISGVLDEIVKRIQALEGQVNKVLERLQFQHREVRPSDSMSIRGDEEQHFVKQLVVQYRALPEERRRQLPGLLNNLGKLELAAGDFGEAQQKFQIVAKMESDATAKAEAHYNAYQAALQRQAWVGALASIRQAIALDAARFSPVPDEYEPTRILGAGGFGVAFLCHHKFMNDDVVVKILQSEELDCNVDRVFTEARALTRLDHPCIIRVSTCGYADSRAKARPYLVMDYFDGVNLESYVAEHGRLPTEDLLAVAMPVAQALQAAHERGILHRDVKPANILVRREGTCWRVKLIDFGLALRPAILEGHGSTPGPRAQTIMGKAVAGTLHYAAPEQMGKLPGVAVGPYSDVYGFGKTCYYALLNTPEPDDMERDSLPEPWRRLLSRCTGRTIANRLPDFAVVVAGLREVAAANSQVVQPPVPPQTGVSLTAGGDNSAGTGPDAPADSWNGEFYCNYGHYDGVRSWADAVQFGFICAGGGPFYTRTLRFLTHGSRIWVLAPGYGYVGVGRVIGPSQPASSFKVATTRGEVPVLEAVKGGTYHSRYLDDPDKCEYFVPVQWLQTVPLEAAVAEVGLFGNQNTVCRPTAPKWRHTVERLKARFPNHDK
jgi:tRNA A-37 threonylcarbamoyl transferase component Bud32